LAELPFPVAQTLAASLVTIGHPYIQAAINATAMDLIQWCKGSFVDGCNWSPEQQAREITETARATWEGGWPENGGTKRLLELFRARFEPGKLGPERQLLDSKKWEEKYGPPDPTFAARLIAPTKEEHSQMKRDGLWTAIRDTLYYTSGPGKSRLLRDSTDTQEEARDKREDRKYWWDHLNMHKQRHPEQMEQFRVDLEKYGWDELMKFDYLRRGAA